MKKKTVISIIILLFLLVGPVVAYNILTSQNGKNEPNISGEQSIAENENDKVENDSKSSPQEEANKTDENSSNVSSDPVIGEQSKRAIGYNAIARKKAFEFGEEPQAKQGVEKPLQREEGLKNFPQKPETPKEDKPENPTLPPTGDQSKPKPDQPKPPVENPKTEDKAERILNDLKSQNNQNVAQFTNDDEQIRTVIWAKGIVAPKLGQGGDFVKTDETHGSNRFVTYFSEYKPGINNGWYDTDKSPQSSAVDINLCFGAVASNQLHWWLNYNKNNIDKFLAKTNYKDKLPASQKGTLRDLTTYLDSFKNQQDSRIFSMMKAYFGNNKEGYYADPLVDMFINGHKPKASGGYNDPDWQHDFQLDQRGGFFYEVFGKRNLTRRMTISSLPEFGREVKKAFQNGETIGVIHSTSGNYTHIITAWGAEYDLDGNITAIYVTDSDDQESPENGLKRYGVKNINGKPALSNNVSNTKSGAQIHQISTVSLGEEQWKEFLNK